MATEQISIRIDVDLLRTIEKLAKEENRTRSNMIEVLLKEALRNRKILNKE